MELAAAQAVSRPSESYYGAEVHRGGVCVAEFREEMNVLRVWKGGGDAGEEERVWVCHAVRADPELCQSGTGRCRDESRTTRSVTTNHTLPWSLM